MKIWQFCGAVLMAALLLILAGNPGGVVILLIQIGVTAAFFGSLWLFMTGERALNRADPADSRPKRALECPLGRGLLLVVVLLLAFACVAASAGTLFWLVNSLQGQPRRQGPEVVHAALEMVPGDPGRRVGPGRLAG